jgi:hypothetical protein
MEVLPLIYSIVGGTIVAGANYLLGERSRKRDRQLDFYKLVYPEKMKAALDLPVSLPRHSWIFARGFLERKIAMGLFESVGVWINCCGAQNHTNLSWVVISFNWHPTIDSSVFEPFLKRANIAT